MKRDELIKRLDNLISNKRKDKIKRISVGESVFLLLFHKNGYFGQYKGIPVLRSRKLSKEGIIMEMKENE